MIALLLYLALGYAILIPLRRLPSFGAAFAVGLAACAFAGFFSGWFFESRVLIQMLQALGVLALAGQLAAWRFLPGWKIKHRGGGFASLRSSRVPGRLYGYLFVLLVVIALAAYALFSGLPVVMYDVLSYHIPLAWAALENGGADMLRDPEVFYARMPVGAAILEAPFTTEAYQGGLGASLHLFVAACVLSCASSAARVAAWLGGHYTARRLAALAVLFHPLFVKGIQAAVYDPAVALMAVAGVELLLWAASRRGHWLLALLAGTLGGTAMVLKFSAAGTALIPLGLISIGLLFSRSSFRIVMSRQRLLVPVFLGAGALLALAPWLYRAQVIGGHPLFPFRGETPQWTKEQAEFVVQRHEPVTPLDSAYWLDLAKENELLGLPLPFTGLSVFWIIAAGIALRRRLWHLAPLFFAGFAGYLFWLTVRHNPDRFLLPAVAILIPAGAVAAGRFFANYPARQIAVGVMTFLILLEAAQTARTALTIDPVQRENPRQAALEQLGPRFADVVNQANEELNSGQVLLFFEARGALFERGHSVYRTVWDQPLWAEELKNSENASDLASRLEERGVTLIFVNEFEWGRLLQFYARESFPGDESLMGIIGLTSPDTQRALEAYPSHRFARLTERDLTILEEFLRSQRRAARAVAPAGRHAEIWYAPLIEPSESE